MILSGQVTHTGLVREHNEDAYSVIPATSLWVIADGMGGHEGGEIASSIAIENITAQIQHGSTLVEAFEYAHWAVITASKSGVGKPGMGSTAVALKLRDSHYEIAWVGDSRAYLWNGHRLSQLSRDHSYVQQLLDKGLINQEEAKTHIDRNIITQSLGSACKKKVDVDIVTGQLFKGEMILLCSDGLTSEVSDIEIAGILAEEYEVQDSVNALLSKALNNGGNDNITILLIPAPVISATKPCLSKTQPIDASALNKHMSICSPKRWFTLGALVAILMGVIAIISTWFFPTLFVTSAQKLDANISGVKPAQENVINTRKNKVKPRAGKLGSQSAVDQAESGQTMRIISSLTLKDRRGSMNND